MYFESTDLYLILLFIFLISGTISLIITEYINQIINKEISMMHDTAAMLSSVNVVTSYRKPMKLAKSIRLIDELDSIPRDSRYEEHMREQAVFNFAKSIAEHVDVTEVSEPMYPYNELHMELYILPRE